MLDIIYSVNYILFNNDGVKLFDAHKVDVNTDGEFNVIDLTRMVGEITSE